MTVICQKRISVRHSDGYVRVPCPRTRGVRTPRIDSREDVRGRTSIHTARRPSDVLTGRPRALHSRDACSRASATRVRRTESRTDRTGSRRVGKRSRRGRDRIASVFAIGSHDDPERRPYPDRAPLLRRWYGASLDAGRTQSPSLICTAPFRWGRSDSPSLPAGVVGRRRPVPRRHPTDRTAPCTRGLESVVATQRSVAPV